VLLVHVLAVLGSLFLSAALFPGLVDRRVVEPYAALWWVVLLVTLWAAGQEWRWHRELMRRPDG
jgi:hypothetical protein